VSEIEVFSLDFPKYKKTMPGAADYNDPTERLASNIKFLAADIKVFPELVAGKFCQILGSRIFVAPCGYRRKLFG
jgi:hypothetical protein